MSPHRAFRRSDALDLPEQVAVTRPRDRRQRLIGGALIAFAVLLLAGTLALSKDMLRQTSALGRKVELTEGIVDGNVRTLSQVQRELLRLDALLARTTLSAEEADLQQALVSQRVQEGSLSYQEQTLGTSALLAQSRALEGRWSARTLPLVRRSLAQPASRALRQRARAEVSSLEKAYNQLVSDGEINRKVMAGQANRETRTMLARAHRLVWSLASMFGAVVLLVVGGALVFLRLYRQRERSGAELYELNRELHRYAHVVRSTDNMVVITDPAGRVDWVNKAFVRTFGYTLLDLGGRRPGHLLQGPATDPEAVARMSEALRAGRGFTEEVLNYARDGREIWVALDVSPVHDDDGVLTGYVAVETDVTERRRAEMLMREAKETAEESAREKATFLASMSHEIRTPLNAVLGLTDLLLLTDLDETQREYVRTAHSSGRLLLALVNDILDFSALEAGRIETEQRAFRLDHLLRDSLGMFGAEADRRGVALHLDLDPAAPRWVQGDETRVRQVLVNLLGNAVKFTSRGEVEVSVALRQADAGGVRLQFAVSDTGIGIPADLVPRLFQPFSQVDASTTRRYGGTGLGLAICRLLVERMGGHIDVVSAVGNGSIFHFELELPLPGREQVEAVSGSESGSTWSTLPRLQVLLAEDDRVNQTVAVHMLRRLGIEPVVVADGRAAVDAVLAETFDLVLMDVHMPTMDGVQATALIRASTSRDDAPYIAAVTANALDGDRERLLTSGMDDYISKPVQLEDLAALVRRAGAARGLPARATGSAPVSTAAADDTTPAPEVDPAEFARTTGIEDPAVYAELVRGLCVELQRVLAGATELVATGALAAVEPLADAVADAATVCCAAPTARVARCLARAGAVGDADAARGALQDLHECGVALEEWSVVGA